MATDPNKALLNDTKTIQAAQPGYNLKRSQWAKVYHGQKVGSYTLTVVDGKVTAITPVP